MRTWATILGVVLLVTALLFGMALVCAIVLLRAGKKTWERQCREDARSIVQMLPKTDCGTCGFVSCQAFAENIAENRAVPAKCPEINGQIREQIEEKLRQSDAVLKGRKR